MVSEITALSDFHFRFFQKKCEKKLTGLAAPDKWKEGSNNATAGSSGRKINQNKLLSKSAKANRFSPLEIHQDKAHYCQEYKIN
ncbi:hypothetical protein RO3G_15973 [Rhizopus delemar RA 99-880]|uniref:Cysteine-rich PDZ-binding protein n=1 Tax=Rhizopus delemar (strain RA 99-880 / ATCC MYA-4621 / FGSC 9543 / NRRL 43880) TaxID=246409 RepID=I1CS32_RHIO9|nr:hypothetical protein RO3G_15973 [Rhizopus delemar RA 99-880]|eukprot:EIE91262.1 hypothetical protein RO3G_15973 [Rhizopus delemar RA 99-880]